MVKKKQQTEKKKPGIYRRIVKWIGLLAISFLIILALIFQAPWKVIALLLIILAACTVLPKPYRKWFWLSAAAVVAVLIIWVFLPDDSEGWQPYTFDEELAALEASAVQSAHRVLSVCRFQYPIGAMSNPEAVPESVAAPVGQELRGQNQCAELCLLR